MSVTAWPIVLSRRHNQETLADEITRIATVLYYFKTYKKNSRTWICPYLNEK